VSFSGVRALAIAKRGLMQVVYLLELDTGKSRMLGNFYFTWYAEQFDGLLWLVGDARRIVVLDLSSVTGAPKPIWALSDLPGRVVAARVSRDRSFQLVFELPNQASETPWLRHLPKEIVPTHELFIYERMGDALTARQRVAALEPLREPWVMFSLDTHCTVSDNPSAVTPLLLYPAQSEVVVKLYLHRYWVDSYEPNKFLVPELLRGGVVNGMFWASRGSRNLDCLMVTLHANGRSMLVCCDVASRELSLTLALSLGATGAKPIDPINVQQWPGSVEPLYLVWDNSGRFAVLDLAATQVIH
jgi:hypothetical protein